MVPSTLAPGKRVLEGLEEIEENPSQYDIVVNTYRHGGYHASQTYTPEVRTYLVPGSDGPPLKCLSQCALHVKEGNANDEQLDEIRDDESCCVQRLNNTTKRKFN